MKRLIRAVLKLTGIRTPSGAPHGGQLTRCNQARIATPRFGDPHLYIERCRLPADHQGDHQPGPPETVVPLGT